jgi:hypothetical protein
MAVERSTSTQVRQGDVLLTPQTGLTGDELARIARDARNLTQDGEAILALGKGGGHPHKVVGENIQFLETNWPSVLRQQPDDQVSRILLIGEGGARLEHDEHEDIELPPNSQYVVFRQLETLVGDDNNPSIHQTSGIRENDRGQPSRRYVED